MKWDGIDIKDNKTYLLKWNERTKKYDKTLLANRPIVNIYTTDGKYIGIMDEGRLIATERIVKAEIDYDCNLCVTIIVDSV